jgi:hypothetical protein
MAVKPPAATQDRAESFGLAIIVTALIGITTGLMIGLIYTLLEHLTP